MIFLSFFYLIVTHLYATELQVESILVDNPDKTFIPKSRSTLLINPSLEHKAKSKFGGFFFLLRSKLQYKHDLDVNRLREGESSSTLLAIKPLSNMLLGASLSAGHLWRWRREFNVNTDRFQEIDGDHFFVESRFFSEKKLSKTWVFESGLTARVEDYASTYSAYVNQQNDNLSGGAYSSLAYKVQGIELKPSLFFNRKLWRERRALSRKGFFVAPGEELKPDRIDTATGSLKGLVTFDNLTFGLTPSWTRVKDLNNDGRSWFGPGIGSEVVYTAKILQTKLRADWNKRSYDTQLSSFQSNGNKRLEEETTNFSATLSGKINTISLEFMHGIERSTSNQTDTKNRKIGKIKSAMTSLSLKQTF